MSAGQRSSTVFLLGAGFSRAISEEMPLLDDLGTAIAARFRESSSLTRLLDDIETAVIDDGLVPLGNVEVWFTSLAVDQPFLSESQNLRRSALFVELAEQIALEIQQSQQKVTQQPLPEWLKELLRLWHDNCSEVLTLNYDTLVEAALGEVGLVGPNERKVGVNDIVGSFPPGPPYGSFFAEETTTSFSLHKLHGSTNWFGRLASSDMLSIVRFDSLAPGWGSKASSLSRAHTALKASLKPMILPPVADKSSLYANPTMSSIWRRAHAALAVANRVVVFGYSVPQTDTSILALLADAIDPDAKITIIDPNAEDVARNLEPLRLVNSETVESPSMYCSDWWRGLLQSI